MRHRSCFQRRHQKRPPQLGLGRLLVALSCLGILFAFRQFFWAALLVTTLVLTLVLNVLAAWLLSRSRLDRSLAVTTARRFWHGDIRPSSWTRSVGPLHVCVFYLILAHVWHLSMMLLSSRPFWGHELPLGLSISALDHMVNAVFILYLLVALAGRLLPSSASRLTEIVAMNVVLLALAGTHMVIAFVSRL